MYYDLLKEMPIGGSLQEALCSIIFDSRQLAKLTAVMVQSGNVKADVYVSVLFPYVPVASEVQAEMMTKALKTMSAFGPLAIGHRRDNGGDGI